MLKITASEHPNTYRVEAKHWTLDPATPQAASKARSLEIDQWLEEIGAHVIRVKDLGAAMEANHLGRVALYCAPPRGLPASSVVGIKHQATLAATHLARLALGEAER
jgi:hypothetical protein